MTTFFIILISFLALVGITCLILLAINEGLIGLPKSDDQIRREQLANNPELAAKFREIEEMNYDD